MSFEVWWDKLMRGSSGPALKEALLRDKEIEMTVSEFRRLLTTSYNEGVKDGKSTKSFFDRLF